GGDDQGGGSHGVGHDSSPDLRAPLLNYFITSLRPPLLEGPPRGALGEAAGAPRTEALCSGVQSWRANGGSERSLSRAVGSPTSLGNDSTALLKLAAWGDRGRAHAAGHDLHPPSWTPLPLCRSREYRWRLPNGGPVELAALPDREGKERGPEAAARTPHT
ncbi:unnamed protein product, partial [Prorocentrum cordatum]